VVGVFPVSAKKALTTKDTKVHQGKTRPPGERPNGR